MSFQFNLEFALSLLVDKPEV